MIVVRLRDSSSAASDFLVGLHRNPHHLQRQFTGNISTYHLDECSVVVEGAVFVFVVVDSNFPRDVENQCAG